MSNARNARRQEVENEQTTPTKSTVPGEARDSEGVTKQPWAKPSLDRLPLNEAQTGTVAGGDSEIFS